MRWIECWEKAMMATRRGGYTAVQYARFADDVVVLIYAHPQHDWIVRAVDRRLREELAKLRVEINEDKSRMVDLKKGESFSFLGFEFRRVLSSTRRWRPELCAQAEEADGAIRQNPGSLPKESQPAGRRRDQNDQSDLARLGELLSGWQFEPVLRHDQRLGGEEGAATSDACQEASRVRLETME
jgi:hypothetical protein